MNSRRLSKNPLVIRDKSEEEQKREEMKEQTNKLFNMRRRNRPEFKLNHKVSIGQDDDAIPKSEVDDFSVDISKDKREVNGGLAAKLKQ